MLAPYREMEREFRTHCEAERRSRKVQVEMAFRSRLEVSSDGVYARPGGISACGDGLVVAFPCCEGRNSRQVQ